MHINGMLFVTEFMETITTGTLVLKFSAREDVEVMIHAFLTSATHEAQRASTRYGSLYIVKGL